MTENDPILYEIEKFIKINPMSPVTFGKNAVNNNKLVYRLRKGGTVTVRTAGKIRAFIAYRDAINAMK